MAKEFSAYAPPLIWGAWQTIESHVGSISFTIRYSAVGDVQVLGKVRYSREVGKHAEQEFNEEIKITTAAAYDNIEVAFKGNPLGSAVNGEIF